jgi:hypothetical protein
VIKSQEVSGSSSYAWDVVINLLLFAIDATELFNAFLQSEEKDGIVKLKDSHGKSLNYLIEEHDTLIVRKSGRHLWTLFSKAMLDGERINGVAYNGMVVLGPEGIGKV